jgi:serine/threonine-protein kinase
VGFLTGACGGEDELRREVESLLRAHDKAGKYFAAPAMEVAVGLLAEQKNPSLAPSLIGRSISHYQVLSLLGAGGMGEVYLAQDTQLGRKVALKLLPTAFTQDQERVRRFKQEARAASSLNHPNILTIHEIGEAATTEGGGHYIVSEFVEGQTLRALLRGGRLDLGKAVAIAEQVAGALGVAHEAGIIHRDIKPENVIVRPDGLVKVLDFGLAKLTEASAPPADSNASTLEKLSTAAGVVMGTISYMSPEQARGEKVDQRTDIFSLGVVLYEMLAGRRPFEGATVSDVIAALLTAEPPPLGQHCADAPVELEQIIGKCLAKEREARYQSAAELIAGLKTPRTGNQTVGAAASRRIEAAGARFAAWRWPVVAALAAVLIVGLVWFLAWRRAPAVQPAQIKSLAVLPLENLSGDAAQEYFADGMTEALISNLTQVRALRVISRTSVMRFKGSRKPLAEIARELNVEAVIEGSVQRAGGRVKITARLIEAVNETPLRSFDYEREVADVLKLQGEVARAVADEIRIQVTAEERARLAAARRINPEAHNLYLLGLYHWNKRNEEGLNKGIEYFRQAIDKDPTYALAYVGLAECHHVLAGSEYENPQEFYPKGKAYAEQALALDGTLAEARTTLASVKAWYEWDYPGTEQEFKRAIDLNPRYTTAYQRFGFFLTNMGRSSESFTLIRRALELDPTSANLNSSLGWYLYFARQYDQASAQLRKTLELEPNYLNALIRLGEVYTQQGKYAEAIAELNKAAEISRYRAVATLGFTWAVAGEKAKARQALAELQEMAKQRYVSPVDFAAIHTGLGERDQAFAWLEKGFQTRVGRMVYLKMEPMFDGLRSDPRWQELIRRIGFPQ